jgi:hypothetical protein
MKSLEQRFWSKIAIKIPSECWFWTACGSPYGFFRLDNKNVYAHRMAWALTNGAIPKGLQVLHRCDTPLCVNPNHLFLGTHKQNHADCTAKGRRPLGEKNGLHKMTSAKVRRMRKLREKGFSFHELAKRFGVSTQCAFSIVKRVTWKHA